MNVFQDHILIHTYMYVNMADRKNFNTRNAKTTTKV